jgi:hypothetical protein
MNERAGTMWLWVAFLSGCDTATLPPAEAPSFTPGWGVQGRFWCWNGGARECYLAESEASSGATNRGWGANFALGYNPVNGRSLEIDGQPLLETDDSDPPADQGTYTLLSTWTDDEVESLDPSVVEGHPDSFLWVRPERAPQSPSHGEVTVLTMTTTSGNPLHQGTADAEASRSVELTYVRPGRCHIRELRIPRALAAGEDFEVTYEVEDCKRARLYLYGVEAGSVGLGSLAPPASEPTSWTDTDELEADLEDTLQFTAPLRGGYVSGWLEADDALGRSISSLVISVQVPVPEGEEPTGEAAVDPSCYEQAFAVVQTCDVPGQSDRILCQDFRACDEDAALELAEDAFAGDGLEDADGCSLELGACPTGG